MKAIDGKDGLFAVIKTEKGEIGLRLFYDKAPMTVCNFIGLAEGIFKQAKGKKYYDGLKFHRVIQDFMIQGGDPQGTGAGGPGYTFPDEFDDELDFSEEGKLAMANCGPNTNGSQFFITHVPTTWLNNKHTIFGEVVEGQDVVDEVEQGDTIISINIIRNGADAEKFEVSQEIFDNLIKESAIKEQKKIAEKLEKVTKGLTKNDDGIYFKIEEEGKGDVCGAKQSVCVEYRGYFTDGSIFDASRGMESNGHEPLEFNTGAGQMIPGFDMMVQKMKKGETRKVVLPPKLAYGDGGYPGVIPPKAYICFDIKLVEIY